MGEAKVKENVRARIIAAYPWCIYCGAHATTTDHCPPKAAFRGRHWPDSYEFPACSPCNSSARLDELVLATLFRSGFAEGNSAERQEWEKLMGGVRNNRPGVAAEWLPLSRNQTRKVLRLAYGSEGDERRRRGWSAIQVGGPLTTATIQRFMIKLGKALYFKHNRHAFDGVLYTHHVGRLRADTTPEYLAEIYRTAPGLPELNRNRKSLYDQFIYRFNHSPEHGVMYAVAEFGAQWVFQLMAVSREMDSWLTAQSGDDGSSLLFRHECFLDPYCPLLISSGGSAGFGG